MAQPQLDEAAPILREFVLTLARTAPQTALSRTAAGTLSILHRTGPQRITTLADHEAITQPAMTGLVQRLESSGLVVRRPDVADRRATLIAITADGRATLADRRRKHDAVIAARVGALDHEQLSLLLAALPAITALTAI